MLHEKSGPAPEDHCSVHRQPFRVNITLVPRPVGQPYRRLRSRCRSVSLRSPRSRVEALRLMSGFIRLAHRNLGLGFGALCSRCAGSQHLERGSKHECCEGCADCSRYGGHRTVKMSEYLQVIAAEAQAQLAKDSTRPGSSSGGQVHSPRAQDGRLSARLTKVGHADRLVVAKRWRGRGRRSRT